MDEFPLVTAQKIEFNLFLVDIKLSELGLRKR